jgi:hypothetical protein
MGGFFSDLNSRGSCVEFTVCAMFPPPALRRKATSAYKNRRGSEITRWAFAATGQGSGITVAKARRYMWVASYSAATT